MNTIKPIRILLKTLLQDIFVLKKEAFWHLGKLDVKNACFWLTSHDIIRTVEKVCA